MEKLYKRTYYENFPSKKTPLNEDNLNNMEEGIDKLDNRIIEQDAKFAKSIEAGDKKIEEVKGKVSGLTDTAASLIQSKSDAITVEKSGTTIVATDSSDKGFEQFKTYGWSEQGKTSGKNLLNLEWLSVKVENGITYTAIRNSGMLDGIKLNGVFEGGQWSVLCEFKLPLGTYTWSYGNTNVMIRLLREWEIIDWDSATFTVTDNTATYRLVCNTSDNGESINNQIIYPMIRLASITDDTYEPYTNGASPNPEYPQPIVSAGQKLAEGNQLLDLINGKSGSGGGVTYTNRGDGTYTRVGTATDEVGNVWYAGGYLITPNSDNSNVIMTLKAGKTYFVEDCTLFSNISQVQGVYTPTEDFKVTGIRNGYQKTGDTYNDVVYPRVFESSVDLGWDYYTGGVKKAYDVGIRKKLTGKNQWDASKDTVGSHNAWGGTWSLDNQTYTCVAQSTMIQLFSESGNHLSSHKKSVKPNDNITISTPGLDGTQCIVLMYDKYGNYIGHTGLQNTPWSIAIPSEVYFIGIRIDYYQAVVDKAYRFNIQLEYGSEATEYEPYTEQTLTLNRVLRGIPLGQTIPDVIKSSPAHMDGVYWDDETQQYYIGDTEDGVNGVYVQRIGECDNSAFTKGKTSGDNNGHGYVCNVPDICKLVDVPLLCTHYTQEHEYVYWVEGDYISSKESTNGIIYIASTEFTTLEEFKAGTDGMVIRYILATPIETPMTDEEIAAYKALHSYKPTTIITNDADAWMEVEYVADTKTHIAQNYVPVTAFNNVLERISALEQLHV